MNKSTNLFVIGHCHNTELFCKAWDGKGTQPENPDTRCRKIHYLDKNSPLPDPETCKYKVISFTRQ